MGALWHPRQRDHARLYPARRHRGHVFRSEIYEGRRKGVPMGRVGSGEDITGVAIFLASDESNTRPEASSARTGTGGRAISFPCRDGVSRGPYRLNGQLAADS